MRLVVALFLPLASFATGRPRSPMRRPHLIRIETRAGHGSGKPTDKQIEEYSDMYAFIARFTGMQVPAAATPAAAR